jgi:dethiobiotin synthetase
VRWREAALVATTTSLPHRYLLLGTDTDVGKTFVCAALCTALLRDGSRVTACKPLETGAPAEPDLDIVMRLCEKNERLRVNKGLRYALAAAPTAAAKAELRPAPSAADVASIVRSSEEDTDAVVVETCGGALTPLSSVDYVADLAERLPDYRTVLIAGLRLGVLSHAMGALEYLKSRGLPAPIVVLNDRYGTSPDWYVESTRADLSTRGLIVAAFIAHDAKLDEVDFSGVMALTS